MARSTTGTQVELSVLFSEPKIPQCAARNAFQAIFGTLSVLFSEPKIPQSLLTQATQSRMSRLSVLFSEPKIPQCVRDEQRRRNFVLSVLFSEPKIPQFKLSAVDAASGVPFSALQRAENSSMNGLTVLFPAPSALSVLFSEPKIPQSTLRNYGSRG